MIGVICAEREKPAVREFFELFKTPWDFWRPGSQAEVVVLTAAAAALPESAATRLVIVFAASERPDDAALSISPQTRSADGVLEVGGLRLPLYTGALTVTGGTSVLGRSADGGEALIRTCAHARYPVIRCGYDLFAEVRHLLTSGQPRAQAATPTLDLHIALLRQWIVDAGIALWEIPPVPPGYQFLGCLTHDVDFLGIRRHRCDRTLAGFLFRASIGSLTGLIRGRRSLRQLRRNWTALLSLPFVYARILPDFWLPFDRYLDVDREFRSTFFVIPFRDRPGRGLDGPSDPWRAVRYGAAEIRPWLGKLKSGNFEVGVHGIDAWADPDAAAAEFEEIAGLTGAAELGIRMHWLYFDEGSYATMDEAGFAYDASSGYNDAVGFRAGTTQVFRPLSAARLLELPLTIQDTALFFPGRMGCGEREALDLCNRILDWTERLGGVTTLSWHERSLVPERQWDGPYRWLLAQLKRRGAYVAPARDVVSWFSARRSVDLQGADLDVDRLQALTSRGPTAIASAFLTLRVHGARPDREAARAAGSADLPVQADSLGALLSSARAAATPGPFPN